MKDKITTISGAIVAVGTLATNAGLHFGHVGSVDGVQAITAVAGLVFAWFAKDKTGKTPATN